MKNLHPICNLLNREYLYIPSKLRSLVLAVHQVISTDANELKVLFDSPSKLAQGYHIVGQAESIRVRSFKGDDAWATSIRLGRVIASQAILRESYNARSLFASAMMGIQRGMNLDPRYDPYSVWYLFVGGLEAHDDREYMHAIGAKCIEAHVFSGKGPAACALALEIGEAIQGLQAAAVAVAE